MPCEDRAAGTACRTFLRNFWECTVVGMVTGWFWKRDDGNSRWDDFPEHRPFWKTWWFRVTVAGAVLACILAAAFLIEWV